MVYVEGRPCSDLYIEKPEDVQRHHGLAEAITDQLRVLGPDHPNTLATRSDLAHWRNVGGDVTGAVTELEQLLTDQLRGLGTDHPDTLATRANLAFWRNELRDNSG